MVFIYFVWGQNGFFGTRSRRVENFAGFKTLTKTGFFWTFFKNLAAHLAIFRSTLGCRGT
jgi:hypothetical protein